MTLSKIPPAYVKTKIPKISTKIKITNNSYYIKPIRIKKPFKYKVRDFFSNISKVFGF